MKSKFYSEIKYWCDKCHKRVVFCNECKTPFKNKQKIECKDKKHYCTFCKK